MRIWSLVVVTAVLLFRETPLHDFNNFSSCLVQCRLTVNCREKIGLAVLRMLEQGHLLKMHNTWWYGKGECVVDDSKVAYYLCISRLQLLQEKASVAQSLLWRFCFTLTRQVTPQDVQLMFSQCDRCAAICKYCRLLLIAGQFMM